MLLHDEVDVCSIPAFDYICFMWPHVTYIRLPLASSMVKRNVNRFWGNDFYFSQNQDLQRIVSMQSHVCNVTIGIVITAIVIVTAVIHYTTYIANTPLNIKLAYQSSVQLIYDWSVNTFSFLCFILGQHQ